MEPELLQRRDVLVEGSRVAVFELGAGPPLLLLHGYPQSHRCWRRVAPALAMTHTVIAPDWFGWGESERSFALVPRFTDEVRRVGALLDVLGLSRVAIAGHDYGGLLALAFTVRCPQRVERLAILNSRCHRTFTWPWYLILGLTTLIARLPGLGKALALLPSYSLHQWIMRRYVRNGSFDKAERNEYLRWMSTPGGRRWFAHFYRYFSVAPVRELGAAVGRLTLPVAVIWGEQDPYFAVAIAEDFLAQVPAAVLTRLADADHYIVEERPLEVTGALRTWLEAD